MVEIFALTRQQYASQMLKLLGRGADHARLIYRSWMMEGCLPQNHKSFKNCPDLFSQIIENTSVQLPEVTETIDDETSKKFLLKLADGSEIESVLLKMQNAWTLCISSQVGCKMGCRFCETARIGLKRNLTTAEIVSQVFLVRQLEKVSIRNLVFMGMGEPFDNFESVMQAVRVLTDQGGFAIGERRVTVSTSGLVPEIEKLADMQDVSPCLAISINGPTDAVRQKLMPVNRRYSMERLKQALHYYSDKKAKEIFAEYVMIKNVNDSLEDATHLAGFLEGLPVKINLIPYNPQSLPRYEAPEVDTIEAFAKQLRALGLRVLVRHNKGRKMMAACGQLGVKQVEQRMLARADRLQTI